MKKDNQPQWSIIKIGGSILVPEWPDGEYMQELVRIFTHRADQGEHFVIIVGGGYVARRYQDILRSFGVSDDELDWIGVHAIQFNAQLMRMAFGSYAHSEIITASTGIPQTDKPILIYSAEEPGQSSNYGAVVCAQELGAQQIINLSNVDYIYDADPRDTPNAKKYSEASWEQYRTFIPQEWTPGLSTPFDPVSSAKAQEADVDVIFMKGKPIKNLEKYFENGEVKGSIISNRFQ